MEQRILQLATRGTNLFKLVVSLGIVKINISTEINRKNEFLFFSPCSDRDNGAKTHGPALDPLSLALPSLGGWGMGGGRGKRPIPGN